MLAATVAALVLTASVAEQYQAAVTALAQTRVGLAAKRHRDVEQARAALLAAFDEQLFPAWEGTEWNFYGATETPREGTIACGYYVTTLLRDAGFRLDRVKLAQQASERIVKAFAAAAEIQRFRDVEPAQVVAQVRERHGPGLYLVGLDYHVAFLRLKGDAALLCHSAVLAPGHATCEPAESSPGMVSRYHVVGPALSDARVRDWLGGREVALR